MNDDGWVLMFWITLGGLVLAVVAGLLERAFTRPSRGWIRRLQNIERARNDWAARVMRDQMHWRDHK